MSESLHSKSVNSDQTAAADVALGQFLDVLARLIAARHLQSAEDPSKANLPSRPRAPASHRSHRPRPWRPAGPSASGPSEPRA